MHGRARILVGTTHIWVRFEQVGSMARFNIVLDAFRKDFPLAEWDDNRRYWRLPTSHLAWVKRFCRRVFGSAGVRVHPYHTTNEVTNQPNLL